MRNERSDVQKFESEDKRESLTNQDSLLKHSVSPEEEPIGISEGKNPSKNANTTSLFQEFSFTNHHFLGGKEVANVMDPVLE